MNEQLKDLSIRSTVSLKTELRDVRNGRWGQRFGTVESVCRQYGIKYVQHSDHIEFMAPKNRIQLFLEKLHFSKTPYSKNF